MAEVVDQNKIAIIDFFFNNNQHLEIIKKEERNDLCVYIFSLIRSNPSKELLSKLVTILYRVCFASDITLEEVWELYWNLSNLIFANHGVSIRDGSLRKLYTYIFESICEVIPCEYRYRKVEERDKETIVIVCSQILGLKHAPTIRVFDYAYTMQHKLKKKVVIINDSGLNFIKNGNLASTLRFNYIESYNNIQSVSYKDEEFRFIQNSVEMPSISAIMELVDIIYDINPLLIYNIGGSSIVADYCRGFVTTASLPCSNAIPISCSKYLLVGRKTNVTDKEVLSELLAYQMVIETIINYEYTKPSIQYCREQFQIDEKAFLIGVVGNRLDLELTDDFIELINQILISHPKCNVVLIGNIDNPDRIVSFIKNKERIYLTGRLSNAAELIKHCDLYLNPKRSGGGRSSFEALNFGVPVLTFNYGDVYYTCGEEFAVKNDDELLEILEGYIYNVGFMKEKINCAKKRAEQLKDIEGTLDTAIDKILENEL